MASTNPDFAQIQALYESLQSKKRRKDELMLQKDKLAIERAGIVERLQEIYPNKNWETAYQQDLDYLKSVQDTLIAPSQPAPGAL
jgi:hypothetical protein